MKAPWPGGAISPEPRAGRISPAYRPGTSNSSSRTFGVLGASKSFFNQRPKPGAFAMSPAPGDRASTPTTVRRDGFRMPQGVRESSALKTSQHLRESKSYQDSRVSSPVTPAGSPLPYRSNPAKHILDGTPLRDEIGATRDVKHPRTSYQPGKSSRPGTENTLDTSNAAKENAAPKKAFPVYKSQAKQMLEAHEAHKSTGNQVRQLEMTTKTTAEMHTEMMQLFIECKVRLSALSFYSPHSALPCALRCRVLCFFACVFGFQFGVHSTNSPGATSKSRRCWPEFWQHQNSGNIIEVRSKSKINDSNSETAQKRTPSIKLDKSMYRRKTKEEMHAEMMQLFADAKVLTPPHTLSPFLIFLHAGL